MNDKMREEFEAWAATHEYLGGVSFHLGCRGDYADIDLQHAFDAWQASRESLVIELPKIHGGPYCYATQYDEGADYAIHHCALAIEAAGLKVKP